jgi:hypothetical protein
MRFFREPRLAAPSRAGNERESTPFRGNAVATSTSFPIVQPFRETRLRRTIWTLPDTTSAPLARLRALSGVSRVGARVSLGAPRLDFGRLNPTRFFHKSSCEPRLQVSGLGHRRSLEMDPGSTTPGQMADGSGSAWRSFPQVRAEAGPPHARGARTPRRAVPSGCRDGVAQRERGGLVVERACSVEQELGDHRRAVDVDRPRVAQPPGEGERVDCAGPDLGPPWRQPRRQRGPGRACVGQDALERLGEPEAFGGGAELLGAAVERGVLPASRRLGRAARRAGRAATTPSAAPPAGGASAAARYQGRAGSAPDLRAGTTASARRARVRAASISPKSRRAMS